MRDSGIGIEASDLSSLLAPNGTNKDRDERLIGEKGVGLTFVIFTSDQFMIESTSPNGHFEGHIKGAAPWRLAEGDADSPKFVISARDSQAHAPADTGTTVTLSSNSDDAQFTDLFRASVAEIIFLLRTRTAIGSTQPLFGKGQSNIRASATFIDESGVSETLPIPFAYWLPEDSLPGGYVDYNDYLSQAARFSDVQKARFLRDKAIRYKGAVERAGRYIHFHSLFVPTRTTWDNINDVNRLSSEEPAISDASFRGAIVVATKGMPTGIELTPPTTGSAGYWPNTFILLEDDALRFDLGRKYIHGRTQGILKDIARDVFLTLRPFADVLTTDPPARQSPLLSHAKALEFQRLRELPDLIYPLNFRKDPQQQEAAVAAIFHELVGRGLLRGYRTYSVGYKQSYDLWGGYDLSDGGVGEAVKLDIPRTSVLDTVIEFKFQAESILKDFERNKYFADIDLIVCWDIDVSVFKREQVSVTALEPQDALFHGSNFELEWPATRNLGAAGVKPVLALRVLLDDCPICQHELRPATRTV